MSRVRYTIEGALEILSPLHVGTGDGRRIRSIVGADGAEAPDVAAIVRDVDNRPYIPPTTLKGLLRRLGERIFGPADSRVHMLFGDLDSRKAGMVLVRGASISSGANASGMPFVSNESVADLGPGVFVAARTSIDAVTGVADDHKLHHTEMVAPLTRFDLKLCVEARGGDAERRAEACLQELLVILGRLAQEDGIGIGRGTADGDGRVRFREADLSIMRQVLTAAGDLAESDESGSWMARGKPPEQRDDEVALLKLVADGPFLVADASRKPKGRQQADRRKPQLAAQRSPGDRPLILGSSIAGALKARARWLSALDGVAAPDASASLDELTAEQRLFGTTSFKGLMSIHVVGTNKPPLWTAASVKIDRFTGGPIQNALFHTEAFVGVRLELKLTLESRPGAYGVPTDVDRALFKRLVEEVRDGGLMLGHGVNRGYGWFRAEAA